MRRTSWFPSTGIEADVLREAVELVAEVRVERRRELHVAEEEERRRAARLRLAKRPRKDVRAVVARVAADDQANVAVRDGDRDGRGRLLSGAAASDERDEDEVTDHPPSG